MSWSHFVGPFGWSVIYPLTGPEPHHLLRTSPRSFLGCLGWFPGRRYIDHYRSPSEIDGHAHSSHINYWCGKLMKHEPIFKIISQATRVSWKTRWWPCKLSHHVTSLVQRWSHDTNDNLQAYVFTLCLIYIHMCIMCEHYRYIIFDDLSIEESTRGGLGSHHFINAHHYFEVLKPSTQYYLKVVVSPEEQAGFGPRLHPNKFSSQTWSLWIEKMMWPNFEDILYFQHPSQGCLNCRHPSPWGSGRMKTMPCSGDPTASEGGGPDGLFHVGWKRLVDQKVSSIVGKIVIK